MHDKMHANQRRDNLQKRLAARRRGKDTTASSAQPVSDASKAAADAEAAEAAQRDALEQNLADEEASFKQDAENFERLIKEMLDIAERAKTAGVASGSSSLPSWAATAVDTAESNQMKSQDLRRMHEREIAAMEMCQESKRRAAATRITKRRAAARAAREEMLRLSGMDEEKITEKLAEVGRYSITRCNEKTLLHQ